MQEGQVACYESSKLNECEHNYVTHYLELAAIIHALNMWRQYLLSRRFVLMSGHSGLRHLFDQPNLNVRQSRWLATMNKFEFEIRYIKRKENRFAYNLSMRFQVKHITSMSPYGTYLQDQILQEGQQDDRYKELMHRLK